LPHRTRRRPKRGTQILKGKEGKGAAEVVIVDVAKADVDNLAIADLTLADRCRSSMRRRS